MKITQQLEIDTDSAEAQEAKRLGIALHDAIRETVSTKDASNDAVRDAARAQLNHVVRARWKYRKTTVGHGTPHWTYLLGDPVEIRIYDYEETP